jgi:hypothetical protein
MGMEYHWPKLVVRVVVAYLRVPSLMY